MPMIHVSLPDDLHARLVELAKSEHRTLTRQIIWMLSQMLPEPEPRPFSIMLPAPVGMGYGDRDGPYVCIDGPTGDGMVLVLAEEIDR